MTRLKTLALSTTLLLTAAAMPACAQQAPETSVNTADRAAVELIIRDYLLENPEIIQDALIELDRREKAAMLARVADDLYNNPDDVFLGPKDAKVTIVEFFDYNCGFCKTSSDWLKGVMEKYPDDVRIVFKELPILDGRTKTSRNAAKAALAAARQGKYTTMHFSMMKERSLTEERVFALAEKAGLDMDKLKEDMKDKELDRQLEDGLLLANRIPSLTGTPFFVINDDFIAGADTRKLDEMLEAALKDS